MSAPEIYNDQDGFRIVYRHMGPPGRGLPAGGAAGQIFVKASSTDYDGAWANAPDGTGAAVGPASSLDATVVLFDGTSGKLLKDSTRTLSYFAARTYVDNTFVAKSGDKVLTDNNFSDADKAKLDSLAEGGLFYGEFVDEAALNDAEAAKVAGAYAVVLEDTPTLYFWDATDEVWVSTAFGGMSGADIATALFNSTDSPGYSQSDCRIFTTALKLMLETHDSILGISGLTSVSYVEKTANYNITNTDRVINVTANSPTLTLPTAVNNSGRQFIIKNTGAGTVTVEGFGTETIDGALNVTVSTTSSITVFCNGSGWIII